MNFLRRLRALLVVSVAFGALAAVVYTVIAGFTSLAGPLMPGIGDVGRVFAVAWFLSSGTVVLVGLGLIAVARGRKLQELSNWRIAIAGAIAGFFLVFGFVGISGGFNLMELRWGWVGMLRLGGMVGAITGVCILALTAIARRGADRDILADIDTAEMLP